MTTNHLIHYTMDMQKLTSWAHNRGINGERARDMGYVLHQLLSDLFGRKGIQPFRLFYNRNRRPANLYGYSKKTAEELGQLAQEVGTPDSLDVIQPEALKSKPMPERLENGRLLGFDVRTRPVIRLGKESERRGIPAPLHRGSEIDLYDWLTRQNHEEKKETQREPLRVYQRWLSDRLEDCARIRRCKLASMTQTQAWRGEQRSPTGRDIVLHGAVEVSDSDRFNARLAEGIGRHKAYGYGMILLRAV